MISSAGRILLALALPVLLLGCAPRHSVRVEPTPPRHVEPARPGTGEYVVVRGDTLYGIAFRHGLDYRTLAAFNRIGAPYTIYPGQRVRLPGRDADRAAPVPPGSTARSAQRPAPATSAGGGVVASIAGDAAVPRSRPTPSSAPAATSPSQRPGNGAPADPPASAPAGAATRPAQPDAASSTAATTPGSTAKAPSPSGPPRWQWPANGALVTTFAANDPTRQGVNIAGSAGQPIHAAADGVVVYSGSGLIGYGELVIVKHSDEWLSAYGHNRRRLVGEGDVVKAGQQIAEMGRSGASRDMLHFEIRRNGKPVDPMALLPRR